MNCPTCKGELEFASGETYARCKGCNALFMNMNGTLNPYPVDEQSRPMIEQSLGFTPSSAPQAAKPEPPARCPVCQGTLEVSEKGESVFTRCTKCGTLSEAKGPGGLVPVVVTPPGGGWNAEFQAIFEQELGFTKKVRKNPPGIVE
jgi:uncharacterized protein YbaR (Trm112 family)